MVRLYSTLVYYREIYRAKIDKERKDYNDLYHRLRQIKRESLQNNEDKPGEVMSEDIENNVLVDWLNCIDQKLIFHVSKVFAKELQSTPLFAIQDKIVNNIEKYLMVVKRDNLEDLIENALNPGSDIPDIKILPLTLWTTILSFLDTPDLKNIVLTCQYLKTAGSHPSLAWQDMTIKSRAVLLFGLDHFLSLSRYSMVRTVDFSFVQLDTFELTSLCKFCLKNPVENLNLSDKIFLELDNELVSNSLSGVKTLKVRYSTFSNDQINKILNKTCQKKKLKVLDWLGANIVGRVSYINQN